MKKGGIPYSEKSRHKYKIGDIIYPEYQFPKKKWYQKCVWWVVMEDHPVFSWKEARIFKNRECAEIYSELIKLKEKIKNDSPV